MEAKDKASRKYIREQLNNCPILLKFLQDNNDVCKFVRNLHAVIRSKDSIKARFCEDREILISIAFSWAPTKEKHEYWRKRSEMYVSLLRQNN